jgi:hypothetical protein
MVDLMVRKAVSKLSVDVEEIYEALLNLDKEEGEEYPECKDSERSSAKILEAKILSAGKRMYLNLFRMEVKGWHQHFGHTKFTTYTKERFNIPSSTYHDNKRAFLTKTRYIKDDGLNPNIKVADRTLLLLDRLESEPEGAIHVGKVIADINTKIKDKKYTYSTAKKFIKDAGVKLSPTGGKTKTTRQKREAKFVKIHNLLGEIYEDYNSPTNTLKYKAKNKSVRKVVPYFASPLEQIISQTFTDEEKEDIVLTLTKALLTEKSDEEKKEILKNLTLV